ncbi:MAG: GNAT family N-acetyltransferase [Sciscionella sp.]
MTDERVSLRPLSAVDDSLVGRWQALADRAVEPNPFAGPDVALPAAAHLPNGEPAMLLAAERGSELVFALPVVHRGGFRHLPLSTLQAWQHPYTFLGTPLLAPEEPERTWLAVLDMLRAQRAASWLVVEDMDLDGAAAIALRAASGFRVLDRRARMIAHRCGAASGSRRTAAKRRRRLAKVAGGEVVLVEQSGVDGVDAAVRDFLRLEASGWKGLGGTALGADPATAVFFRELCHRHAARGALRLLALQVDGRAIAMICLLLAGGTTFCFKVGHDDALTAGSPGSGLLTDVVTEFHESATQQVIDSCAERLGAVTAALFPDVRMVGTVLAPTRTLRASAAAAALPRLVRLRRTVAAGAALLGHGRRTAP